MNIFEMATRNKFRFAYNGRVDVEGLWDLNREALDEIYQSLTEARDAKGSSLLAASTTDVELDAKIEIVKYIFDTKSTELDARKAAAEKAAQKRKINDIIARKQDADLEGKSVDELIAMVDSL